MPTSDAPKRALPPAIDRLAGELSALPGVGRRSGLTIALALSRGGSTAGRALATAIRETNAASRPCAICATITDQDTCETCRAPGRREEQICVVQRGSDAEAVEQTGRYQGTYHILHGALEPLRGIGPDRLTIPLLMERLRGLAGDPTAELILATGTTLEGTATADYIARSVRREMPAFTISILRQGIADRALIEFSAPTTMRAALDNREGADGDLPVAST